MGSIALSGVQKKISVRYIRELKRKGIGRASFFSCCPVNRAKVNRISFGIFIRQMKIYQNVPICWNSKIKRTFHVQYKQNKPNLLKPPRDSCCLLWVWEYCCIEILVIKFCLVSYGLVWSWMFGFVLLLWFDALYGLAWYLLVNYCYLLSYMVLCPTKMLIKLFQAVKNIHN